MKQKICQSCGMPMKKPGDFGTNNNHTLNEEYCKYCFQKGKFTDEGISMAEKIEKNVQIAMTLGMDEDEARDLAQSIIPGLKRWRF